MRSSQATSVVLLATFVGALGTHPGVLFKNFKKVSGHSLMGNETATLEVDDSLDCSFACVKDIECFSYNFGSPGSMERPRKICELSNSIKAWDPQNFKRRPGFDYYGMDPADMHPCLSSPCNNGGLCTEPLGRYKCACPLEIRVLPYIDDKCNVEMDLIVTRHSNSGVFHAEVGRNQLNFYEAERLCEILGARLATYDQLHRAWKIGYEQCSRGWLADSTVRLPVQEATDECGNKRGILGSDEPKDKAKTYNAYCHR